MDLVTTAGTDDAASKVRPYSARIGAITKTSHFATWERYFLRSWCTVNFSYQIKIQIRLRFYGGDLNVRGKTVR